MPPVLTPEQIAQLTKDKAKAESASATFTNQVAALNTKATELGVTDSAFKSFFDYYNTSIIGKYDLERKSLNGEYITSPIVEQDLLDCANLTGRILPTLPVTDVVRISQFDGTPFVVDPVFEKQHILDQAATENTLVNGYGGTSPSSSILTTTAITSTSTTLQLRDNTTTFTLAPNSVYVVQNGGNVAVFKVLTFVMQVSPVPPPYVANLTIQLIVPPTSTIGAGQQLFAFTGFTNAERTSKITTNPNYQPLMNSLIADLQAKINLRISRLNEQLALFPTNQDPDGVAQLSTATTQAQTSKTFLTNYLVTTIISNAGITSLSSERGTRSTFITTRLAQIMSAYTGRTENYYQRRYDVSNDRANTMRGTLRLQKSAQAQSATATGYASSTAAQATAIGNILP